MSDRLTRSLIAIGVVGLLVVVFLGVGLVHSAKSHPAPERMFTENKLSQSASASVNEVYDISPLVNNASLVPVRVTSVVVGSMSGPATVVGRYLYNTCASPEAKDTTANLFALHSAAPASARPFEPYVAESLAMVHNAVFYQGGTLCGRAGGTILQPAFSLLVGGTGTVTVSSFTVVYDVGGVAGRQTLNETFTLHVK